MVASFLSDIYRVHFNHTHHARSNPTPRVHFNRPHRSHSSQPSRTYFNPPSRVYHDRYKSKENDPL